MADIMPADLTLCPDDHQPCDGQCGVVETGDCGRVRLTTIREGLRGFSRAELRRRAAIFQALSEQPDRPRAEQRDLARRAAEMDEASNHAD